MASGVTPKYMDGTDTGWQNATLNTGVTASWVRYRKIGNIVSVHFRSMKFENGISAGGNATVGSIASSCAPDGWMVFPLAFGTANFGKIGVNTSGGMTFYTETAITANTSVEGVIFYFV